MFLLRVPYLAQLCYVLLQLYKSRIESLLLALKIILRGFNERSTLIVFCYRGAEDCCERLRYIRGVRAKKSGGFRCEVTREDSQGRRRVCCTEGVW